MEDYYEYLDSNGVTTLYKLIKDDTVALIDSYSVTLNGITTTLDTHINDSDIHTPITDIENMVDTKISGLVNSAPETLDTLKELSDALGNDPNFATTIATQIGSKANSVHNHVVSDITDFPIIPTKVSDLTNDSGYITGVAWEDITSKPSFSDIAISGSYNDLVDTPNIPTKTSDLTNDSGYISNVSWGDISNKPKLSQVAISGSYSDLSNTPTIPTKLSQLENDMGFGTGGGSGDFSISWTNITDKPNFSTVATSGSYTDLSNTPNIPTKLSDLSNDSGFAIDSNVVHKTGREVINGDKVFQNTIYRQADITTSTVVEVYRFTDTNATPCGAIYNRMHWYNNNIYNRHQSYNATSGKDMYFEVLSHNDGSGVVNTGGSVTNNKNLTTVTNATGNSYVATMGWVNNPATSTNVVHRSGDETIDGNKTFSNKINGNLQGNADTSTSATYATTQATSDNSTRIATTAWVRTYVNSVVGSGAVGASISAYYSNNAIVTAEGNFSTSGGSYPSDYSDYINISPTVGTIYTGSQLFGTLNASASGTKKTDYTSSGPIYYTTAKATATFGGAFSASAKYLCTTANAVKFRAYVEKGTNSDMGAASVVNQSSAKSIFIRVQ